MQSAESLMGEVETFVRNGSSDQRINTLRKVAALFLRDPKAYAEEQVALFDNVLERLIDHVEAQALAGLSAELAPIDNAPINVIRRLSRHDEIRIASPVLEKSTRLTEQELADIAGTKSQAHLLAIAGRRRITPVVTDVLVRRGNSEVAQKAAGNAGAEFSTEGYSQLVKRAETDESLADRVANRADLPPQLFQQLVTRASEAVMARLLNHPDAAIRKRLQEVQPMAASQVTKLASDGIQTAQQTIANLVMRSRLPADLVTRIVSQRHVDAILIICKAAQLSWPAAHATLTNAGVIAESDEEALRNCRTDYLKLTSETAQRVIRFMKAREAVSDTDLNRMVREHAGLARRADPATTKLN